MPGRLSDHDQEPAADDRSATVAVAEVFSGVRLEGAIFLRGEYTESWAYESVPSADLAAVLAPRASRVLLFHVVARGRCWIEVPGGERHWAEDGDVIVLPYNHQHRMGGTARAELVPVATLLEPPPWERMPVIRHGRGGPATSVVCGYLVCEDALFDPRLAIFPPVLVVSPPVGPARDWVRASIEYAVQQTSPVGPGRFEAGTRLPEMLLVEVLGHHLTSAPAADRGLARAVHDPVLRPALAAIHGDPGVRWSVAMLADRAHVSASLLDERFREVLGLAPIRYLTGWRMHVAEDLLGSSDLGVAAVARRVGYESEEAFSRAFKRAHGQAPSHWRDRQAR